MKSNRWLLIIIAAVLIVWAVKSYAGTLQMTTYYPAPSGFYEEISVKKKLIIPCQNGSAGMPNNALWINASQC
jgi:hypothetical protein